MVTDTITGIGDQNITFVVLWACDDSGCVARRKEVTPDLNWSVNFAVPGELNWESVLFDIQPETTGGIYQSDEDNDGTNYSWSLNQPPHADLGPDLVTDEGSTLMLDASASSDPESGSLTYDWDLDNDGEYDDAVGVTTIKPFPDNGTYIISLKVTDEYGESDTDTMEINAANISPNVDIQQASVNNLGVLTGSGSFTDPGADLWTATVDYGDGSGAQLLALNPDKSFPLNHAYIAGGIYTVEVCVSDDDSGSGCDQAQVTVTLNHPPVAEAGGPYYGNEGTSITLNASRSTDSDGNIVRYEWDLDNDGQFDDAAGVRPMFAAIDNGVFTVRVRVTDAGGLSSVDNAKVTVKNVPPVITSLTFNFSVRIGVKLNTLATFKDAGINDTFTATWKWGDGTTSTGTISGKTVNGSHTYTKPGIYLITITVKDKDGGVGQAYKLIFVLPKK
jgi:PKD repeat protein